MTTWRKVLAWEVDEPEEEGEVPQEFTPVDPIDVRIYSMPEGQGRKMAIADRVEELERRQDSSLHEFTAPFTEQAYGTVYLKARSMEEAQIVLDFGRWHDSETQDYENFEISGPPELR
jgi:hypothetical protein